MKMNRNTTAIEAECPVRIDFTGGFTDISPFRNKIKTHETRT